MNKGSAVGWVYIGVQYEFVNWLNGMSRWRKCCRRRKGRFVGAVDIFIIMRLTNDGKDNVPSKSFIILLRIKSLEDMWCWFIAYHFFKAKFRWRCHNRKVFVEWGRSQGCGMTVGCCMTWLTGDENSRWIRAHQKGYVAQSFYSKFSKADPPNWEPTGIVICHNVTNVQISFPQILL